MTLLARYRNAFEINAISTRLLLASALLLPAFLGLTGFFLHSGFKQSQTVAEETRLRSHLYLLFSVAELNGNDSASMQMPNTLLEPEFERLDSGLYAYIYDGDGKPVWHSNSAALKTVPAQALFSRQRQPGELIFQHLTGQRQFASHYDVIWEDINGDGHPFRFVVTHTESNFNAELRAYRSSLWQWLGAAGLFLILVQSIILHWGLRPLKQLAASLAAMQNGETRDISGQHPRELQQIVDNLNLVLAREQSLRQRYRNSLSDLAHSLKTPLAVLQSKLTPETRSQDLQETVAEQVQRMNQVVTYQLQRAVASHQQGNHQFTPVAPLVQRLVNALQKVYRDKMVTCDVQIGEGLVFAGDEQDLMELLGNLLDNAFKYGERHIMVCGAITQRQLCLTIQDDGSGIPATDRERILQRGQRLDTQRPGQGIGLAVVLDIINSYQGSLAITDNGQPGTCFSVCLPGMNQAAP